MPIKTDSGLCLLFEQIGKMIDIAQAIVSDDTAKVSFHSIVVEFVF